MSIEEREHRTFQLEKLRAVGTGVLETAGATFLILIAERWFHFGPTAKSLLLASGSLGLLLTPLVLMWAAKRTGGAGKSASWLYLVAAAAISCAALAGEQYAGLYVAGCFGIGIAAIGMAVLILAASLVLARERQRPAGNLSAA